MILPRFERLVSVVLVGCVSLAAVTLHAGSETVPAAAAADTRPVAVQMDEYLKAQHIDHAVELPSASNGQTTTVKIYGVNSPERQEALCAGLSVGGKRDRLQGVNVQFLALETRSVAGVQTTFQPSSLPSGNGNVVMSPRAVDKPEYRVQRTVKLQELVSK